MSETILMCPPTYFEVSYQINPWMNENVGYKKNKLAQEQWETLHNALAQIATVEIVEPVDGLPDMVFTANAGLSVDKKVFLSEFKHKERKGEEEHFKQWFLDHGYYVVDQSLARFEGEGDCLPDAKNIYWMGHGFRTDAQYANSLWKFGVDVRAVKLVDNRFYHIDTCFCPFSDGTLMYYPGAFDAESRHEIERHFSKLSTDIIRVTEEEAVTFCCNAVVIGRNVFMPQCPTVASKLRSLGYNVQEFDMSEFQKSGGAVKCLCMHL